MKEFDPSEVTRLLERIVAGDQKAEGILYELTFEELQRIARSHLRQEANATLQTTELVHEVFLRLQHEDAFSRAENRRIFFGSVALAMRRILVDAARKRQSQKRGGDFQRQALDHVVAFYEEQSIDLLALDEAIEELSRLHLRQAQVVQMRWLSGQSIKEVADLLEVSEWTVEQDWRTARAFLLKRLSEQ